MVYRMLIGASLAAVVVGVALLSPAAAWIVGGLFALVIGTHMRDEHRARRTRDGRMQLAIDVRRSAEALLAEIDEEARRQRQDRPNAGGVHADA